MRNFMDLSIQADLIFDGLKIVFIGVKLLHAYRKKSQCRKQAHQAFVENFYFQNILTIDILNKISYVIKIRFIEKKFLFTCIEMICFLS